jgi:hypothetical protein
LFKDWFADRATRDPSDESLARMVVTRGRLGALFELAGRCGRVIRLWVNPTGDKVNATPQDSIADVSAKDRWNEDRFVLLMKWGGIN